MTRTSEDRMGSRKVRNRRRDVAANSAPRGPLDAACLGFASRDSVATMTGDTALLEKFMDLRSGEEAREDAARRGPAPVFRERLRRRLWRMLGISGLQNGSAPN